MKPRAQRVTIAAAVLGAAVVAVLVAFNWRTIRDHVVAWSYQLTRETEMIEPDPAFDFDVERRGGWSLFKVEHCILALAAYSGRNVLLDSVENPRTWGRRYVIDRHRLIRHALDPPHSQRRESVGDAVFEVLRASGWRVLEQRFPRRAYVVIWDKGTTP